MHSQKKHPERLISQAEAESEIVSPFLEEVFSDAQLPELENLETPSEMFLQESPFLNVFENVELGLDETDIQEYEEYGDDDDSDLEDNESIYEEDILDDLPGEEADVQEENNSEEYNGNLDAESDGEWEDVGEIEEVYAAEELISEGEFSENESDYEQYWVENENDIEEREGRSDYGDTDYDLESDEENETTSSANEGVSPIALQAEKQWNASKDRLARWINNVYGLVVHTTGGSLPGKAIKKGIYPTLEAMNYYTRNRKNKSFHGGCHYINGWQGMQGGDLLQIANERVSAM